MENDCSCSYLYNTSQSRDNSRDRMTQTFSLLYMLQYFSLIWVICTVLFHWHGLDPFQTQSLLQNCKNAILVSFFSYYFNYATNYPQISVIGIDIWTTRSCFDTYWRIFYKLIYKNSAPKELSLHFWFMLKLSHQNHPGVKDVLCKWFIEARKNRYVWWPTDSELCLPVTAFPRINID